MAFSNEWNKDEQNKKIILKQCSKIWRGEPGPAYIKNEIKRIIQNLGFKTFQSYCDIYPDIQKVKVKIRVRNLTTGSKEDDDKFNLIREALLKEFDIKRLYIDTNYHLYIWM